MTGHTALAVFEHVLSKWVHSLHSELLPISNEALHHRADERVVFGIGSTACLFKSACLMDDVIQTTDTVL